MTAKQDKWYKVRCLRPGFRRLARAWAAEQTVQLSEEQALALQADAMFLVQSVDAPKG